MSQTRNQPPLPNHNGTCSNTMSATRISVSILMAAGLRLADQLIEGIAARVTAIPELFLDTQQLVVLSDTLGTRERASLDLQRIGRHGDIGDGGVFGFAGTMGNDGSVTRTLGGFDRLERFGQGTDLVDLDQDGVGHTTLN